MAVEVIEVTSSRGGQDATDRSSRAELVYSVSGTDDLATARSAVLATAPLAFDGLVYKSLSREYLGNGLWEFTASYVEPDRADSNNMVETGEYVFSFDTSGGTVTRTTSWATAAYAKSGETPPNFANAINVVDGDVRGVDITIPALKLSIRKRQPKANITLAYVNALYQLTGTVNNASFLGFAAGELLFLGASGQQGTDADPEITYNFLASQNVTGLSIGGISGIDKPGHAYLWAYFEPAEDTSAKATVRRPKAVYVETVYPAASWSGLM